MNLPLFSPQQLFKIFGYYDSTRFVVVRSREMHQVRCIHPEPGEWIPGEPLPIRMHPSDTLVYLVPRMLDFKYVGDAGKCEVCGKVYYQEVLQV